jgi:hypothetical protein
MAAVPPPDPLARALPTFAPEEDLEWPLPAPLPEAATPELETPTELEDPPVVGASGRLGLRATSKRP